LQDRVVMDCFATLAMTTKVTEFRFEKFRLCERSEAIHVVYFELFVVLDCFATLAMTTWLRLREKRSATKRRSDLPAGRQVHVVRAGRLREAKPKRPASPAGRSTSINFGQTVHDGLLRYARNDDEGDKFLLEICHCERNETTCLAVSLLFFQKRGRSTLFVRIVFARRSRRDPRHQKFFDKSFHSGLSFSINSIFFFLEPLLICFSLSIADKIFSPNSK